MHTVDAITAAQWQEEGTAWIIDVREPDEVAQERIPGTLHLPLAQVTPDAVHALIAAAEAANAGAPRETLVLQCALGGRSGRACAFLAQSGMRTYNLEGGITAWKAVGLPVVRV